MVWTPMPPYDVPSLRSTSFKETSMNDFPGSDCVHLRELVEDHPDELVKESFVVEDVCYDEKPNRLVFIESKDDTPDFDWILVRIFGRNKSRRCDDPPTMCGFTKGEGRLGLRFGFGFSLDLREHRVDFGVGDVADRISVVGGHGRGSA